MNWDSELVKDGTATRIWKHPDAKEYVFDPEDTTGWFLLMYEHNGDGKVWRLYGMYPKQDYRSGEPEASQSLEVYDDVWQAVKAVASGRFVKSTITFDRRA